VVLDVGGEEARVHPVEIPDEVRERELRIHSQHQRGLAEFDIQIQEQDALPGKPVNLHCEVGGQRRRTDSTFRTEESRRLPWRDLRGLLRGASGALPDPPQGTLHAFVREGLGQDFGHPRLHRLEEQVGREVLPCTHHDRGCTRFDEELDEPQPDVRVGFQVHDDDLRLHRPDRPDLGVTDIGECLVDLQANLEGVISLDCELAKSGSEIPVC
jgi:hypothetical protein